MTNNNYGLAPGESVVLENDNVRWITAMTEEIDLQKIVLSNLNLIYIYKQRTNGLFSRNQLQINKRPLSDIRRTNGFPMVSQTKHPSHGLCLEVQFIQGTEFFIFYSTRKKTTSDWRDAIWTTLTGSSAPAETNGSTFSFFKKNDTPTINPIPLQPKKSQDSFCPHCGARLISGAKFCSNCGKSTDSSSSTMTQKPAVESNNVPDQNTKSKLQGERVKKYAGVLIKCPACGENLPSFVGNCPSCGHEINSVEIDDTITDFTARISQATTDGEKKRAIEAFSFPNDRESILEGLLYIRGQIESLSSNKADKTTSYWATIWKNKAKQLYQKAEILFPGDKIANDTYSAIVTAEKQIKHGIKNKTIIKVAVLACIVLLAIIAIKISTSFRWPTYGIATQIPKPPSSSGEITFNDENQFIVNVKGVSKDEYNRYIEACRQKGFTIDEDVTGSSFEAYNESGYRLRMYLTNELHIDVEAPKKMESIRWPKSNLASRIPTPASSTGYYVFENDSEFSVFLSETTKEDYRKYVDSCYVAGFTQDREQGETYFRAYDADGYYISAYYEGNDIMHIWAKVPEGDTED